MVYSYLPSPMLNNNSTYWIRDTSAKCSPNVWHRNECWQLWCQAPPFDDWGEWRVSHPRHQALKNPMGKQAPSAPPESKRHIAPWSLLTLGVWGDLPLSAPDYQEVKPGFRAIFVYCCVKCFSFLLLVDFSNGCLILLWNSNDNNPTKQGDSWLSADSRQEQIHVAGFKSRKYGTIIAQQIKQEQKWDNREK